MPLFTCCFLIMAWIWRPRKENRSYMLQQLETVETDNDPFSYELQGTFVNKNSSGQTDFSRHPEPSTIIMFENDAKASKSGTSRRASPTRPKGGADDDEYENLVEQDLFVPDRGRSSQ